MTGAKFEIRIDGSPRSYRDRKDYAMGAARLIKSKNPHSMVEIKDLQSGDVMQAIDRARAVAALNAGQLRGRDELTGAIVPPASASNRSAASEF
jgi:hypothetical protein